MPAFIEWDVTSGEGPILHPSPPPPPDPTRAGSHTFQLLEPELLPDSALAISYMIGSDLNPRLTSAGASFNCKIPHFKSPLRVADTSHRAFPPCSGGCEGGGGPAGACGQRRQQRRRQQPRQLPPVAR